MAHVHLGSLTLQPRRQLLAGDQRLPLGRRALDILSVLAEAGGEIVTKEELLGAVWPGVIVEENAIHVHVTALRKALGSEAGRLETIRGLGFRLDIPEQPGPVMKAPEVRSSVAVLPFANLSGEAGKDYLCDGFVRELLSILARDTDLQVPSWQSCFFFRERTADIRVVARQLGVEAVVEGWIKIAGDKVRVGAQLIDARTGFQAWSERFDGTLTDLLGLDGELAGSIAKALQAHIRPTGLLSPKAEAFDEFLKGHSLMANSHSAHVEAVTQHFRRAADLDRQFGKAHASLAQMTYARVLFNREGTAAMEEGRRAAERALALDSALIEAHTGLAFIGLLTGDWQLVEDHSGLDDICPTRTAFLSVVGQLEQAKAYAGITIANNPLCHETLITAVVVAWLAGDDEAAARWMAHAVAAGCPPAAMPLPMFNAEMALKEGDVALAAQTMAIAFGAVAEVGDLQDLLRRCYGAIAGESGRELALAALHRFRRNPRVDAAIGRAVPIAGLLMLFLTRLGDVDGAYEVAFRFVDVWHEDKVLEQPSLMLLWGAEMAPFRMDPRFADLAAMLGFSRYWRRYGLPEALVGHPLEDRLTGQAAANVPVDRSGEAAPR